MPAETICIAYAQLNPVVGDLVGNKAKLLEVAQRAAADGATLVVFPELFLAGYNAQDLYAKPVFAREVLSEIEAIAKTLKGGPTVLVGAPYQTGDLLHNAVYALEAGRVKAVFCKHHLPNYLVFDEYRVFDAAAPSGPVSLAGIRIGVPICEDAWFTDICETYAETGAELLIVPNGSPYARSKHEHRQQMMVRRVIETGLPLLYVNQVGGQDDQVFDGASFVLNRGAELAVQSPEFTEEVVLTRWQRDETGQLSCQIGERALPLDEHEADYYAMTLGLRDYLRKNGFQKVVLGLSGGVDSALVAVIAADAIGAQNVWCVMMPSRHTSDESLDDARALIDRLGASYDILPIGTGVEAIGGSLAPLFEGREADITEENIQSRLRGLYLMALSNKFGHMLLTTGNKSEVAVGYATIYGDMCGGYNPLKDLYKTRVFEVCRWRNSHHRAWMLGPDGAVIPQTIIDKPPSAELRPDQKDSDSLPPYDILDGILELLIEGDASVAECIKAGYDAGTVRRVAHLLYISEHKRFQSAPGPRLSGKAFWLDRRYPITNRWRDKSG